LSWSEIHKLYIGLVALIIFAVACGPVIPASPATTVPPPSDASKPPPATLIINGNTQVSGIGSYCWSNQSTICADMGGIPTSSQPLVTIDTPFTARFQLPLDRPPDSLYISVMPAVNEIDSSQDHVRLWEPANGWSGELPLKKEVEYEFQESGGLYIFQLNSRWKEYGDVTYGFLVQVGKTKNPLSPTSTQSPASSALTSAPVNLSLISSLTRLGKGVVASLEPSPDGKWLAIATSLGVYLYDVPNQKEVWFIPYNSAPRYLAFSADGSRLAIGLAGNVMPIVDVQTAKVALELKGEEGIHGVWSPDGKSILTSAGCEQVLVWNAESGQITHTVQASKCNNVNPGFVNATWSWDGKRIYVNRNYGYVSAWDAETYQPLTGYQEHPPEFAFGFDLAPSPTQNLLAIENGLSIAILDGETGRIVKQLGSKNRSVPLNHVVWSPDGKQLLADQYLWNVETGQLVNTFDDFIGLSWLPDGDTLIGLSISDGSLKAVSATSVKTLYTLDGFGPINGYSSSLFWDGDTLLTYNGIYQTRWNPANGQILERHSTTSLPAWVSPDYAPLSPDGRYGASPNAITETNSKKQLAQLDDHPTHDRDRVAWSPDGKRLVSGDSLGLADTVVWDAETGKVLFRLPLDTPGYNPYLGALAWSPKGKWILEAGSLMNMANGMDDGMIALWNAQTGEQAHLLTSGMKSERIGAVSWSPDQHWLAAGSDSGNIFLWDMQSFAPVAIMSGHVGGVIGLSWSADGNLLASSSQDGTVLIWKLP
jgi:WD40 repeat protein